MHRNSVQDYVCIQSSLSSFILENFCPGQIPDLARRANLIAMVEHNDPTPFHHGALVLPIGGSKGGSKVGLVKQNLKLYHNLFWISYVRVNG